jgi:hypothetical protein
MKLLTLFATVKYSVFVKVPALKVPEGFAAELTFFTGIDVDDPLFASRTPVVKMLRNSGIVIC